MIVFKQIILSEKEISDYLKENDDLFVPALSKRLNIEEYAKKLHFYATHFSVFDNDRLVGMAACYFNDMLSKTGYISTVSVKREYQGLKILTRLLSIIAWYGELNKFEKMKLEVRLDNAQALHVYKKSGYVQTSVRGEKTYMELRLCLT